MIWFVFACSSYWVLEALDDMYDSLLSNFDIFHVYIFDTDPTQIQLFKKFNPILNKFTLFDI